MVFAIAPAPFGFSTEVVERVVAGATARAVERDSVVLGPNERDVQLEYTALALATNIRKGGE